MLDMIVTQTDDEVEVVFRRDLDAVVTLLAAERCRPLLSPTSSGEKPRRLILRLEGLQFIDSRGAQFLLCLSRLAARRGCRCGIVTGGNRRIHRILGLLGLEVRLPLYLTRTSAILDLRDATEMERQ